MQVKVQVKKACTGTEVVKKSMPATIAAKLDEEQLKEPKGTQHKSNQNRGQIHFDWHNHWACFQNTWITKTQSGEDVKSRERPFAGEATYYLIYQPGVEIGGPKEEATS